MSELLPRPERDLAPRRTIVLGGVIFNPWINIPACVLLTLAAGTTTVILGRAARDVAGKPAYEDQRLDLVGTLIGTVVMGVVTIVLAVATVYTVRWWRRAAERRSAAPGPGGHGTQQQAGPGDGPEPPW